MGNLQSYVVASASVCSVYLIYVHVYRSHKLSHTCQLRSDTLPSYTYLYLRYLIRSMSRTKGRLLATSGHRREFLCTVSHDRLDDSVLRRFCSAAGYGWDYPDSEYRDIPLCFPEFLCHTPLLLLLTDQSFRLSPAGLTRVRQTLTTHLPVDELKKGPFELRVRVLEYRPVDAGVEVDVQLSAVSRLQTLVWESVLTLLSTDQLNRTTEESDTLVPEDAKQVMMSGLHPVCLLRPGAASGLWMLSASLAEVEKHRGVAVLTAPVVVSVRFHGSLRGRGKIRLQFWGEEKDESLNFRAVQPRLCHMEGVISRSL